MISPWIVGVIAMVAITAVVLLAWDARRSALIARGARATAQTHAQVVLAVADELRAMQGGPAVRRCAQCGWELRLCDVGGCRGRHETGWRTRSGILS